MRPGLAILPALIVVLSASASAPGTLHDSASEQLRPTTRQKPKAADSNGVELTRPTFDSADSWPLFRGNAKATGVTETRLPVELDVLWEFEVEKGAFEGTAAIENGLVYIGDLDGRLYALDLKTGEKKWEFVSEQELGFVTAPAVNDGDIFIGDIGGLFYCIGSDGSEKWRYETMGEINSSANFHGQHVIFGSQDAILYCLDMETGREIWKFESNDQIRCSPTIVEDRVFVAGCDGHLHIVDLKSGESVANVDIRSQTGVTPAVMGNHVFFGTEGAGFYSIDWKHARLEWNLPVGNSIRASPAVIDDKVVFGGHNRTVYCVRAEAPAAESGSSGETADDSDEVPLPEEIWTFRARDKINTSPVISEGRVYIGSDDGRIYVLNLEDGGKLAELELGGEMGNGLAAADGKLVVATMRGVVYCLGKND